MKLKSLKLAGFKSFVDATLVPIRSNMNAVVGPNGCGKSNIVDAIRWVIGETSAKQLRGQSMSDVIFNGTTARKPVGKASIELVFENKDGRLVGEYAKFTEIAIKREVTREGQSDYYINGASCRRRDIVDIFLGTGLGTRGYSIIEQGMVSRLVEAKPEDMRMHIEEASGISKYKERRRETETRIRHTQENLERLSDVREELGKQLRHLQRQVNAAERYQEYKAEENVVHAQIKGLQWQSLQQQMTAHDERIEIEQNHLEEQLSDQRSIEADIEKGRAAHVEFTEQHNEIQKRYYGLGADIARIEQQIKDYQEQTHRWQKELAESEQLWQELSDSSVEYQEQIQELEASLQELTPQSSTVYTQAEEALHALTMAEVNMKEWQQEWDAFQTAMAKTNQAAEVLRTNIHNYEERLQRLDDQHARLTERGNSSQLQQLEEELEPMLARALELDDSIKQVNVELESLAAQITEQRQINQQNDNQLDEVRDALQAMQSQYASLNALQQSALGYDNEASQRWLTEQQLENKTRLGQSLHVQNGWELAVETVMQGCFDAVCVDDVAPYLNHINQLSAGHLMLVDQHAKEAVHHREVPTLMRKVSSEWPLEAWLSGIYIADDVEQAERLRSQLGPQESVITPNGTWMGASWVRVAKAVNKENSIILRAQAIDELQTNILVQENRLQQVQATIESGEERVVELEDARDALHHAYQETSHQLTQAKSDLSAKQSQLHQLKQQQRDLNEELEDCLYQQQQTQQTLQSAILQLKDAEISQEQHQQQREYLEGQRIEVGETLENSRRRAQQEQQKADELGIRISSNERQLSVLKQTMERDMRQLSQLTERRESLSTRLADTGGPLQILEGQLQNELNKRLTIEQELHQSEDNVNAHTQHLEDLDKRRNQAMQKYSEIQNLVQELRMQRQETCVRQRTIEEQVAEAKMELQQILAEMPAEANLPEWESCSEKIAAKISRLGPINLAAIEEYKTIEERKEYLDKQNEDLVESLNVLDNAIRKIDRETKARFKETFDKVNEGFQRLFPKIFGGGRAYLELTDDDILSTGILVKAQPPGKKNATIHMLSGGEKALTAIALVFAMFQLNPAPFCVLDEVDAPLDDVNVGRFCQIVKEMSQQTQFIVISHNKVTIEAADHLLGITMQEAGVSRVVAVDMEEALEMASA